MTTDSGGERTLFVEIASFLLYYRETADNIAKQIRIVGMAQEVQKWLK